MTKQAVFFPFCSSELWPLTHHFPGLFKMNWFDKISKALIENTGGKKMKRIPGNDAWCKQCWLYNCPVPLRPLRPMAIYVRGKFCAVQSQDQSVGEWSRPGRPQEGGGEEPRRSHPLTQWLRKWHNSSPETPALLLDADLLFVSESLMNPMAQPGKLNISLLFTLK